MSITKGPWTILPLKGKYYGTQIMVSDSVVNIWGNRQWKLSPREIERSQPDEGYTPNEIMSDGHYEDIGDYEVACLIAAAPELYEALKAIERLGDNDPDCNHCGEYLDAREIARKAIAKAEGRE